MTLEGDEIQIPSPEETIEILHAHMQAGSFSKEQMAKLRSRLGTQPDSQEESSTIPYGVRRISEVCEPLPKPVLAADGMDGFLLAVGENMVVAGEGGSGKTAMVTMIAANHACLQNGAFGQMPCRFFHGRGGQVLLVSYEDRTSILREKIIDLVNIYGGTGRLNADICVPAEEAVKRVWVLGEKPQEMYGHAEGFHIDTRPEKLPGWHRLWKAIDGMKDLVLLIIDPALAAYTANPNSTPHIRQYLNAISHECVERDLACMIVHHSTKDSRFVGSMDEYDENDLFDPGKLSGAAGWSDGIRGGALTMAGRGKDYRKMGIVKASWGSDRVVIDLDPITLYSEDPLWHGMFVGWQPRQDSRWRYPVKPEKRASKKGKPGAAQNGNGGSRAGSFVPTG